MRSIYGGLFFTSLLAIAGCSASHERERCGPTTCDFGQICCNASCGICITPGGGGCIELACTDGGVEDGGVSDAAPIDAFVPTDVMHVIICGGIAGTACPVGMYCDYPDGSYCGGDDTQGRCVFRPDECPEPGGVPVCGCDGNDYLTECTANLMGVDVAHLGECELSPRTGNVAAFAECGPTDGPAWRLEISSEPRTSCDERAAGQTFLVDVWQDLEGFSGTIPLEGDFATGAIRICEGDAALPCLPATGRLIVETFHTGEVARMTLEVTYPDGTSAVLDGDVGSNWCRVTSPGCA